MLPPAVRKDIAFFFGDPLPLGVGPIQLVPGLPSGEPEHLVEALERLDSAELAVALLARHVDQRDVAPAIRRAARRRPARSDDGILERHISAFRAETRRRFLSILDDPEEARRRYLRLLNAHMSVWFRSHYGDISPFLLQRARQARRSVGKLPTKEVIARATNGFTFAHVPARSVTLAPSYYAAPFVFVVRGGDEAVLVYGARPSEAMSGSAMDANTVRVLRALGDHTRLRIMRALARRPLYGQQIAEMLGVSHPTVSHHMALLRIAGLTRTELTEDGSKTYSVQHETVERLCGDLRSAFVDGDETREGSR